MSRTGKTMTVTAAAAAAIGAYWFYGQEGARHRKEFRGWALRMKGDILENLEKLGRVERENYHRIVDRVAARYDKLKRVNGAELEKLVKELKDVWGIMKQDLTELKFAEPHKGGKPRGKALAHAGRTARTHKEPLVKPRARRH